ncbi:V-type proton ATPase subunit G-like protein [Drosera capensis]
MEANRGQNGIQLLLAAEQEAQHIVNAARNGEDDLLSPSKLARMKQAKEEAEKEVAEFRARMEAEFQRKLAEVIELTTPPLPRARYAVSLRGTLFIVFNDGTFAIGNFVIAIGYKSHSGKGQDVTDTDGVTVLNHVISACLQNPSGLLIHISAVGYANSSGDSGANVKRLELETDAKIEHLKAQSARISPDVVQMLLNYVTAVKN